MHIVEIETFGRGGLSHYAHNLSVALVARGHRVSLLTAASYELDGVSRPPGLHVVSVLGGLERALSGSLPAVGLGFLRKLEAVWDVGTVTRRMRAIEPDLVHFHCTNRIAWLYLSRLQRLDCPLVVTAHVVTPHESIAWQNGIYSRIHRRGDLIIAHSEFDRQRLVSEFAVSPERLEVIPHGDYRFVDGMGEPVDRETARRSLGLDADDEVALFFGYIREYKGLDVLLEAWPEVGGSPRGDSPLRLHSPRRGRALLRGG